MLRAKLQVEEEAYRFRPADNGAGPMWCFGSTCLVRRGEQVFMSGLETLPEARPLNNCRWTLLERTPSGWQVRRADDHDRTREPCPMAILPGGRLMMSVNPTLAPFDQYSGPSEPRVLEFSADEPAAPFRTLLPSWEEPTAFTEHSYRGLGADGESGELLLLNVQGHQCYHWSFLDAGGAWSARGRIPFRWGAEYEVPEAVRVCYPNVAVVGRAVHLAAISDIVEPVKAWRQAKREITGQEWDYEFRRLFYCWTPDVTAQPFSPWTEVAGEEAACGQINHLDLHVDAAGAVHLLWIERNVDLRIRDRFFPGLKLRVEMVRGLVRDGRLERRDSLLRFDERGDGPRPVWGRLQPAPDGRLFVLYATQPAANWAMELCADGTRGQAVQLPVEKPLTNFMTATPRGGSPASLTADVIGTHPGNSAVRYLRVELA